MRTNYCWILCTQRTGSSLLCDMLNSLKCFPIFKHPKILNHDNILFRSEQSFNEWLRLYKNEKEFLENPPQYCKVIFHQFYKLMGGNYVSSNTSHQGFDSGNFDEDIAKQIIAKYNLAYLRLIFPEIHFIHLTRKPISHAVSLYFARYTRQYHVYDDLTLEKYLQKSVGVEDNLLLKCYQDALKYHVIWKDFLNDDPHVLHVDYSDMVNQPQEIMHQVIDFLKLDAQFDPNFKQFYKRTTRREATEVESHLEDLITKTA